MATTINLQVSADGNDGHEYPQNTWNAGTVWMGHYGTSNEWAAFRFTNVTVPQGATIDSATFTLTEKSDEGGTYTTNCKVRAQLIANASAPGASNLPSTMTPTTAGVDMDVTSTNWNDNETTAVTVTTIIQEIVNQASWASGNALNMLVLNDGTTGNQDVSAYDYAQSTTKAAKLDITYSVAGIPASQSFIFASLLAGGAA